MKAQKPALEKISPSFGSSLLIRQYPKPCPNKTQFWHYHPEMELVYVNGGSGKRHIGSHLSYFNNGELILIGPNLPHYGFTDRLSGNKLETVIHWRADFLGEPFLTIPEMAAVKRLFERARKGLSFHNKTKKKVGAKMENLVGKDPHTQLIRLLVILNDLANSTEYSILNVDGFALETQPQDNDRINVIFNYVSDHYLRQISLEEIAEVANMTVPAFCRYFKRMSGKTFTRFVNEMRLVHASKLLAEKPMSITDICFESGFQNFSHFNKKFKEFSGKSPSEYRNSFKQIVQ